MDVEKFLNNLKENKHFSFVRYQDGELIALVKYDWINDIPAVQNKIGNCDGHLYFDEMCNGLNDAVCSVKNGSYSHNDKYIFSITLDGIIYCIKDDVKNIYGLYGADWPNRKKSKDEILKMLYNLKENIKVKITPDLINNYIYSTPLYIVEFINILNMKNTIIIGPEYLKKFKPLNAKKYISIPLKNCFLQKTNIISDVENTMNRYENKNEGRIFLFSASMATNYMIDKLFERSLDKHTLIDTGSLFDNFFSKNCLPNLARRNYKPEFIKKNYPNNYWIE